MSRRSDEPADSEKARAEGHDPEEIARGSVEPASEPMEKTENNRQALGTTSSAHSRSRQCQPAQTSSSENSRRKLQNVLANSTAAGSALVVCV